MNCTTTNCSTVQIIEPGSDLIVDTAGTRSDMDERGQVALSAGQTSVAVVFAVAKLNADYHFEYLYIDVLGNTNPGGIQIIPTTRAREGFTCLLAGSPIGTGYVLYWRVVIVTGTTSISTDAAENLYVNVPRLATTMTVTFANPRSSLFYGFTELRVENVIDPAGAQAIIRVQVVAKALTGFVLGINPRAPTVNYFLRVRTP